ncbi:tRNA 2-selenouridine synthase [Planoprotostelium fungivorum]|uniref:tRNA 2-selenouridine synthase n=1 Tax=Planoprotostelium fungivorum TaxID=1890364 RepID=A0A2P6NHB5_9EUKA|nr:tRNA 2-selenouridine synthase [Planoprotostelium fungivorum]
MEYLSDKFGLVLRCQIEVDPLEVFSPLQIVLYISSNIRNSDSFGRSVVRFFAGLIKYHYNENSRLRKLAIMLKVLGHHRTWNIQGPILISNRLSKRHFIYVEPSPEPKKEGTLSADQFLSLVKQGHLTFDVRSPSEFKKGHLCLIQREVVSLPLLNDEERAEVGTIYKQEGRQKAILNGLKFIGGRMHEMVSQVEQLHKDSPKEPVLVYCARGGMRSQSVAWLLNLYGGYKSYRKAVLDGFDSKDMKTIILGGQTGSAKTEILKHMKSDLNQQIHSEWTELNEERILWLENESKRIGDCTIPEGLWKGMKGSPLISISIPIEERVDHLMISYGLIDSSQLIDALLRIRKKLGNEITGKLEKLLNDGDRRAFCRLLLEHYYDKLYNRNLENYKKEHSDRLFVLEMKGKSIKERAEHIMNLVQTQRVHK